MLNLAVIGCGIIGSRHAQALAKLNKSATIYLVDPSETARNHACNLFQNDVADPSQFKIYKHGDFTNLPSHIDVAIIATSANIRRSVTENLLATCKVDYLILEKFLFQSLSDYSAISQLLKRTETLTWVNCPRRMWPGYKHLKKDIQKAGGLVSFEIATHGRFGIGTSAIHLLDALAYLSDDTEFTFSTALLDPEILPHRSGGIDLTGTFFGHGPKGSFFRYTAYQDSSLPPVVQIDTPHLRAIVNEPEQTMRISREADGWEWHDEPFGILPQSQMTNLLVEDLTTSRGCGLPSFAISSQLHVSILEPLLVHYRKHHNPEAVTCPIT